EFIERTKCVTPTEAAEMLGLSKGRISHMLKSGVLQAVRFGDERLVTIASINKRKKASVGAGRPKTEHTTSFTSAIKVVYSGQLHTNQDELKSLDNSGAGVTVYRTKEPLELSPLESDVLNYEGVCRLGDSEKKCMVAKAPKGMVDIIVAGDGSGLFDGANEFDSITVYPRRAVMIDDIELEYFKS
ncbi:MAG: helix-turn-helix domain-containing protein, partial [Raoultibacter sp.]